MLFAVAVIVGVAAVLAVFALRGATKPPPPPPIIRLYKEPTLRIYNPDE